MSRLPDLFALRPRREILDEVARAPSTYSRRKRLAGKSIPCGGGDLRNRILIDLGDRVDRHAGSNWPIRYRFLGVVFALGMGCTYLWSRRVARQQIMARRYFEALAQIDPMKLAHGALAADLPVLPATNPWSIAAAEFTRVFHRQCERLEHAELAKAALDVRYRRNIARHEQMATIVGALPEAVIIVDPSDQVVFANPAAGTAAGN